MSDIVDRLKEPEAHYPGNFETPKRANAMLSCLCQEAIEEIESLRQQLAEKDAEIERLYKVIDDNWVSRKQIVVGQLRERQLLKALDSVPIKYHADISGRPCSCSVCESNRVIEGTIALPQDTAALQAMIAKAGEMMLSRAIAAGSAINPIYGAGAAIDAIRALPGVTLEDLK